MLERQFLVPSDPVSFMFCMIIVCITRVMLVMLFSDQGLHARQVMCSPDGCKITQGLLTVSMKHFKLCVVIASFEPYFLGDFELVGYCSVRKYMLQVCGFFVLFCFFAEVRPCLLCQLKKNCTNMAYILVYYSKM